LRYCAPCHGADARGAGPDADLFEPAPRNLHGGFLRNYPVDALVARVRSGERLALVVDPAALRARTRDVEDLITHLNRLASVDWQVVESGWEIYADRCESCHGPRGKPPQSLPAGLKRPADLSTPEFQQATSDVDLAVAVRHGKDGMPALAPQVTKAEASELTKFVRLLSPGFTLYSRYCSVCHGDDGKGLPEFARTIDAPTVALDRDYLAKKDREELRVAVWHMLDNEKPTMPHFRWTLNEKDVQQIFDYLRASEPVETH
jgi:mono/diheme cytochrome c family protein